MNGWDRISSSSSSSFTSRSRNNMRQQRIPTSRTVRLGRVQPQAPGYRTIFVNDREPNQIVRFRVWFLSHFLGVMRD
ncbi:hypothetical protein L6164_027175 [Bauhinia variegata]|uniref:Uncharacterized protein n=1 Tax=Bauhinia variegata TaxID=167791 RepID=A0ACB9LSE4_BAUVA|nr:hypothetical protein L6164_027175 [Bauhinia variegata]